MEQLPPDQRGKHHGKNGNSFCSQEELEEAFDESSSLIEKPELKEF